MKKETLLFESYLCPRFSEQGLVLVPPIFLVTTFGRYLRPMHLGISHSLELRATVCAEGCALPSDIFASDEGSTSRKLHEIWIDGFWLVMQGDPLIKFLESTPSRNFLGALQTSCKEFGR